MTNITTKTTSAIEYICMEMMSPFPFEKIYIDELNFAFFNEHYFISPELIEANNRFINHNGFFLEKIIRFKKEQSIKNLYFEMKHNKIKNISLPENGDINDDYFNFIENDDFTKFYLDRKIGVGKNGYKDILRYLMKLDPNRSLKISQYMSVKKRIDISYLFELYVASIWSWSHVQVNNRHYIREAIFHPFSLKGFEFEVKIE